MFVYHLYRERIVSINQKLGLLRGARKRVEKRVEKKADKILLVAKLQRKSNLRAAESNEKCENFI